MTNEITGKIKKDDERLDLVAASRADGPFLSLEQMHQLVTQKKQRRNGNLNIFIFSIKRYQKNNLELTYFFKLLAENVNNKETPQHFQLAILDESQKHWFAIDCYLKQGHLYLFIIDPANLSGTLDRVRGHFDLFFDKNKTIFLYNGLAIQRDKTNCAFFTINLLFRLSTANYLDFLLKHLEEKYYAATIYYPDENNLPPCLAFIFSNMQSLQCFCELSEKLKKATINKKGESLMEVVEKNTREVEIENGSPKAMNLGIIRKREKYKELAAIPSASGESSTLRQGFEVIGGSQWALTLIKSARDFKRIFEYLTQRGRTAAYNTLKNKLPDLIENAADFRETLSYLKENQRTAVYDALKDKLSDLIENSTDLGVVLEYLTSEQCKSVCRTLKNKLSDLIKNAADSGAAFKFLTPKQRTAVYEVLETSEEVKNLITELTKYGKKLENHSSSLAQAKMTSLFKITTAYNNPEAQVDSVIKIIDKEKETLRKHRHPSVFNGFFSLFFKPSTLENRVTSLKLVNELEDLLTPTA